MNAIVSGLLILACSVMLLVQLREVRRLRARNATLASDVARLSLPRALTAQARRPQTPGPGVVGFDACLPSDADATGLEAEGADLESRWKRLASHHPLLASLSIGDEVVIDALEERSPDKRARGVLLRLTPPEYAMVTGFEESKDGRDGAWVLRSSVGAQEFVPESGIKAFDPSDETHVRLKLALAVPFNRALVIRSEPRQTFKAYMLDRWARFDPSWEAKADAFQKAYAEAKGRAEEAELPATCVYADCDDDPTKSVVDASGHVTGLCARHSRHWARLDEDGKRAVRTGGY